MRRREATERLDPRLDRWLAELVEQPGLTAATDSATARALHVDVALEALPLITGGPVIDVGTGCGSPGIPLAVALPGVEFHLLDASRRKCEFLRRWQADIPNIRVIAGRAEDVGRERGRDAYVLALARALAPLAVALEWALPLVRPGGRAVLLVGPSVSTSLDSVARELGARHSGEIRSPGSGRRLLVYEKLTPTPARFPRKTGIARKRPLG